jgi:hypothetical protein
MFGGRISQRAIKFLACDARRLVCGEGSSAAGTCSRCGYLGWTYADEHDMSDLHRDGEFASSDSASSIEGLREQ